MNHWTGIGNLTKDPELKYSRQDKPYCKFRIAVNDGYGDYKTTSYVPITVFGKQAENCEKYIGKGSKVCVHGRISTDDYENESGERIYTWGVIADEVEFLGGGNRNNANDVPEGFGQNEDFHYEEFNEMA